MEFHLSNMNEQQPIPEHVIFQKIEEITPEVGYESGPILPFNEAEMTRVVQYDSLLRLADKVDQDLKDGKRNNWVWTSDDPHVQPKYMYTIDEYFLEGIRHAARSLKDEYQDRPHMAEAFLGVEMNIEEEKKVSREFEIRELQNLWEHGQ